MKKIKEATKILMGMEPGTHHAEIATETVLQGMMRDFARMQKNIIETSLPSEYLPRMKELYENYGLNFNEFETD